MSRPALALCLLTARQDLTVGSSPSPTAPRRLDARPSWRLAGCLVAILSLFGGATASANDHCVDAVPLALGPAWVLTPGSTMGATTDTDAPADCGTAHVNAPGVWYRFVGTGGHATLSTCPYDGGDADFDSQISVYKDECGELTCVDGNDDQPGGCQSGTYARLTVCARVGTTYHVLVHGSAVDPEDTGHFVLALQQEEGADAPLATNPTRDLAEPIDPGESKDGTTTCGDHDDTPPCCRGAYASNTAWYVVMGNGHQLTATTCPLGPDDLLDTVVSVFTDTPDGLQCLAVNDDDPTCGFASTVTWCAPEGQECYVVVQSYWGGLAGPFSLSLSEEGDPCDGPPENGTCSAAQLIVLPTPPIEGSTSGAPNSGLPACIVGGLPVESTAPNAWYRLVGAGRYVVASTCPDQGGSADYDTKVTVYSGPCADLHCVAANDNDNECVFKADASTVEWFGVAGTTYRVMVHGQECDAGSFELAVRENGEPGELQPPCVNALGCPYDCLGLSSAEDAQTHDLDDFGANRCGKERIDTHSGQEVRDETDLALPGRDGETDLRIRRRHVTRLNQEHSIFGPAWAFNYRHAFVQHEAEGDLVVESFGRKDLFVVDDSAGADHVWLGGEGRFQRLVHAGNESVMRLSNGTTLYFATTREGMDDLLVGVLTSIVSPDGNSIELTYDAGGPLLERKLRQVRDSFDRVTTFFYEDTGHPDFVSRIRDFSGREATYEYDGEDRLVTVHRPGVASTDGLDDFPSGKSLRYEYSTSEDPKLKNALTAITFPNEFPDRGARLTWGYDTNPQSSTFGWVTQHGVGPGGASGGGRYTYAYTLLGDGSEPGEPYVRASVLDRSGALTELVHDKLGQVLSERIASEPATVRVFEYTPDGDLLKTVGARGGETLRTVGGATRMAAANETRRVFNAGSGGGESVETQVVYEPIYNKPFKTIDPRDHVTTYVYDYMEDLPAALGFAGALGLTEETLQGLFNSAGITALANEIGGEDVNGDGTTSPSAGHVIKVIHPDVDPPSTVHADELFRYNGHGQLTYHRDAELNVTTYEYFPASDPSGLGDSGPSPAGGGFLARVVRDAVSANGRDDGTNPPPVQATTQYEYGPQENGRFPASHHGVPTAIIDPRGVKDTYLVNELDQVVEHVRASSTETGTGLHPFRYSTITLHDANDNVREVRVQDADWVDPPSGYWSGPAVIVTKYERDRLDHVTLETLDAEPSRFNPTGLRITNRYSYDEDENLTQRVRGVGTPEESTDRWGYDERDLLTSHTRGVGTPDESTTTLARDEAGNVTKEIDATGDETRYGYDGHDRLVSTTDRTGSIEKRTYDKSSNVISVEHSGTVDGEPVPPGSDPPLLARTDTEYDARHRVKRVNRHIFHHDGRDVGAIDPGDNSAGLGLVTEDFVYDRLGRVLQHVDAEGDVYRTTYDGLSRVLTTVDPVGNRKELTHDANGNLVQVRELEASPFTRSLETFVTGYAYDALNRRKTVTEPNGQVTAFQHDSHDTLIRSTDQLGNVVENVPDTLGRIVERRTYLSASGTGANRTNNVSVIRQRQGWDALSRVVSQTDDRSQETRTTYDALDRCIRLDHPDGTFETWTYTPDDEVATHVTPNGAVLTWSRDAEGFPFHLAVARPAGVFGTSYQDWKHDGLHRAVMSFDNNGLAGGGVTSELTYDSLGRPIRERQSIRTHPWLMAWPHLDVDTEWQGLGRKVSTAYPNGRIIARKYDALDRLFEIHDIDATYGPLIARYDYVGPYRDLRTTYRNGAVLDRRSTSGFSYGSSSEGPNAGYDSNRRPIRVEWKKPTLGLITSYLSAYNGPGGIGTNHRVSETRVHLGRTDMYTLDSAYRQVAFTPSGPGAQPPSTRTLNGTDKMTSFIDAGYDRHPVIDGPPGPPGVNQYTSFNGMSEFYDDDGSLRLGSSGLGVRNFDHDAFGRLIRVGVGPYSTDSANALYLYTADGRRVLKHRGGLADGGGFSDPWQDNSTRYTHDGWRVVDERDQLYQWHLQFVDGRGIDEHVQTYVAGGGTYYHHANAQGSLGALTDPSANVVFYAEYGWLGGPRFYSSSGQPLSFTFVPPTPYLFQGARRDPETGFYYWRHRYYDSFKGEFITRDPLGTWSAGNGNGYSAFASNPWDVSDPMGLVPIIPGTPFGPQIGPETLPAAWRAIKAGPGQTWDTAKLVGAAAWHGMRHPIESVDDAELVGMLLRDADLAGVVIDGVVDQATATALTMSLDTEGGATGDFLGTLTYRTAEAVVFTKGTATLGRGLAGSGSLLARTLNGGECVAGSAAERTIVNLGGEAEVGGKGIINVQPGLIGGSHDIAYKNAMRVKAIAAPYQQYVIMASGNQLPFPTGSVDIVILNSAPLDAASMHFGPSFTTAEVRRILKDGGHFILNGVKQ